MFISSLKREIRHLHVVVVQKRERNVEKNVMHVQSWCHCLLKPLIFFTLSLPSESESLDLKVHNRDILGDPGAVSWAGRKCATKVYKHGRKSPWVRTLTGSFPNGQANAGSWLGTKNALYYCAQSANSISCVLFVSSYTTAIISPHLPGSFTKLSQWETKELSMSPKTFGCYQQEQFNLHWQNYVSDRPQCIVNDRMFTMQRKRESKKGNSLTRENNDFARASRFFVHFFAVTARLPRENA